MIEALAGCVEAKWIRGLSNLAVQDPVLARRVVERLCASMDAGGGIFVPAWPEEGEDLSGFAGITHGSGAGRSVEAARAWLESASAVLCWVVDDAGSADPATGRPVGTVGVANLTDAPVAAWMETNTPPATPEIVAGFAVEPSSHRRGQWRGGAGEGGATAGARGGDGAAGGGG